MARMSEMTIGQIGRGLSRYKPFVATVAAVALLVIFIPGEDNQPGTRGVTAGGTATTPGATAGGATSQGGAAQAGTAGKPGTGASGTVGATAGAGTSGAGAVAPGGGATGAASGGGAGATTGVPGAVSGGTSGATPGTGTDVATSPGGEPAIASGGEVPPVPEGAAGDPNCDPATGRVRLPTIYAPKCADFPASARGGNSYQGVTENEIIVAVYRGQANQATTALLTAAGADDSREQIAATREAYVRLFEQHLNTYGRKIKLVYVEGSGAADNDAAAKADAIKVATEIKAFISWGDPNNTYVNEVVARGVMCFCTVSQPIDKYLGWAPYVFSPGLMASTQGYVHRSEYIAKKVWLDAAGNRAKAKFAGDATYKLKDRAIAIVYYETKDNVYKSGVDFFVDRLRNEYNIELADRISYILDLAKAQEDARTIIARLKSKGVTTLFFSGDPLMPIFLTQEASNQNYRPEWLISGSALTDTTFFARTYDKTQWAQAFGISYLSARGPQEEGDAYRLHAWHYGRPPEADDTYGVIYPVPATFAAAVHLAGPELTPFTFRDALFYAALPAGGAWRGGITSIAVSYGQKGLWPWDDYLAADDATEIWWDNTARGRDEIGNDGVGMYQYVDGGIRFLPGKWPTAETKAFVREGAITIYATTPKSDRWPDYEHKPHA